MSFKIVWSGSSWSSRPYGQRLSVKTHAELVPRIRTWFLLKAVLPLA